MPPGGGLVGVWCRSVGVRRLYVELRILKPPRHRRFATISVWSEKRRGAEKGTDRIRPLRTAPCTSVASAATSGRGPARP